MQRMPSCSTYHTSTQRSARAPDVSRACAHSTAARHCRADTAAGRSSPSSVRRGPSVRFSPAAPARSRPPPRHLRGLFRRVRQPLTRRRHQLSSDALQLRSERRISAEPAERLAHQGWGVRLRMPAGSLVGLCELQDGYGECDHAEDGK